MRDGACVSVETRDASPKHAAQVLNLCSLGFDTFPSGFYDCSEGTMWKRDGMLPDLLQPECPRASTETSTEHSPSAVVHLVLVSTFP